MNPKYTKLSLLIMVMLALVACGGAEPTSTPVAQGTAATQTGPRGVLAEGEVVPLQFTELSFQTGGQVAELLVAEGDQVEAGAPLIQLDATDLELALSRAEARVAAAEADVAAAQSRLTVAQGAVTTAELAVTAAEAQLALVKAGPRPEEVEAAEKNVAAAQLSVSQAAGQRDAALNIGTDAQIRAAEAQVAAARADFVALQDAYDNIITTCFKTADGSEVCPLYGPVEENTRAQLQAAEARLNAAQARLDQLQAGATPGQRSAASGGVAVAAANGAAAEAQLNLLLAGATPEQIQQAEVGVERAQFGVEQAKVGVVQAEAAVTQAEARLATAQAALESAQVALERMTLHAPFAGTVAKINTNVGEIVGGGLPVVTFADLSGWQVKTTDLTELDVADVEPGAPVEITFDAIPGRTVNGTVADVALVSSLSQGDVVYEVTIDLDPSPDLPLRWGMTAFVDVGN